MLAASTDDAGDQLIGGVVMLPNEIVNVPAVSCVLNASRCTSLCGRRELGVAVRAAVTPPARRNDSGATGRFCRALLNTIVNGPPSAPTTATLPLRAGIVLS